MMESGIKDGMRLSGKSPQIVLSPSKSIKIRLSSWGFFVPDVYGEGEIYWQINLPNESFSL